MFLISNIFIIPFLSIIIIIGLFILFLAIFNILPIYIANCYNWIISKLISFVIFISNQDNFILKKITLSLFDTIIIYLVLLLIFLYIKSTKIKYLISTLISIIILQIILINEKHKFWNEDKFIVFHKKNNSLIAFKQKGDLKIITDIDSNKIANFHITKNNINHKIISKKINAPNFNNNSILIVDSFGIYNLKIHKPIVVLTKSPKINLHRLIKKLNPKIIIADGSNYKNYINYYKKVCEKEKIPFTYTGYDGSYTLSIK